MVLILSLVMGACSSSEDTADTKPTKSDNTIPDKDKEETVKVTFDLNYTGATATPPDSQTIKKGSKAKVPTPQPTRTGYKLTDWYTDQATTKTFAFATPINADITLYAGWQKTVYTVTFDSNGGTGTVPEQSIPKNGKATAPTTTDNPTKDGYTFDGWYIQQDGSGTAFAFTTTLITADTKLYAGWTAIITYTVTFDLNGGTGTAPDPQTIEKDKNATAPTDPTRDGYLFDGWYTQQDGTGTAFVFGTTTITTDSTLYAKWIQIDCREARKALTHAVPLYNQGETDAPYLPKVLRGTFERENRSMVTMFWKKPIIPDGKENQLPYIYPTTNTNLELTTGGFDITPDHIDASIKSTGTITVRISCYSVKEVEKDNLYFYYGKVRFLRKGKESEALNKSMYAWTGIDKRVDANKDALYGYMVSIQGDYLRPLRIYPFVGGKYTRAATGTEGTADYVPKKTVIFPRTEAEYAALTLEDLNIIATAPLTSDKLFARYKVGYIEAGIYTGPGGN